MSRKLLGLFISFAIAGLMQSSAFALDLRWQSNPILVCLPPNPNSTLMKQAFQEWQKVTKDKVTFNFLTADSCPNAKITVSYAPNKTKSLTSYSYRGNYFTKANIEMGLLTKEGNPAPKDVLLLLMEHEIGHAIGITGHTNTPKSVMQPTVKAGYTITNDSINEVYRLYK
ncbi:hypothetical protein DBY21_10450 [Candidatus Gastranaerophilales bacterium]|nr:MAG: hypothetical protein DBY21_10450 [Candidatus Gastranaerophilales bacterium]